MIRLLLVISFFQILSVNGQSQKPDTAFVLSAYRHVQNLYSLTIQSESDLYNGTEYAEYKKLKTGQFPFFMVNDWSDGSVLYGGELYENVPLMFDISRGTLIVEHAYNHAMVELITDRIDRFSLQGHTFVRITGGSMQKGFYDLLYNGKTKVFAKWDKNIDQGIESQKVVYFFKEKTRHYILKNGTAYLVGSKSSALNVFQDRKGEVRHALAEKKIRYRADREKALAAMAEIYDSLQK